MTAKDPGLEEVTRGIPVLRPKNSADMLEFRTRGLREATLYQVTMENRDRLCYVEYRDGSRRINIWTKEDRR